MYSSPRHPEEGVSVISVTHDNSGYWREFAQWARVHEALVVVKFVLTNRSVMQLTGAKLEVLVEALDGQSVDLLVGSEVPQTPRTQLNLGHMLFQPAPVAPPDRDFTIDNRGDVPVCSIRFGVLLPGEQGRANDTLAIVPKGPGRVKLTLRTLAAELAQPHERMHVFEASGPITEIAGKDVPSWAQSFQSRR